MLIIAWTIFIAVLLLILGIAHDCFVEYRRGDREEGAKAFVFILFLAVVASLPADYIFGG